MVRSDCPNDNTKCITSTNSKSACINLSVGCNALRNTLTILSFLLLSTTLVAQKVRLVGDNSLYLCMNDSIIETFKMKLEKGKVDSTIAILYDFDNGRLDNSRRVVIWTHNGQSNIRIVDGCDKITMDTTYLFNAISLWEYIRKTSFADGNVPI